MGSYLHMFKDLFLINGNIDPILFQMAMTQWTDVKQHEKKHKLNSEEKKSPCLTDYKSSPWVDKQ